MRGLTYIVVFAFLFVSVDFAVSQSSSGSRPSKKDCPESRGYKWLSCLMVELSCSPKSCARYRNTDLVKNITCKKNTTPCGSCVPKYYLNDREINCDTVELTGYDCPPGVRKVNCALNPCESTTCRDDRFLVADCKPNYCGGCFAEYFVDNKWQRCPVSVLDIQPDALVVQSGPRGSAARQSGAAERAFSSAPRARQPGQSVVDAPVCPNGQTAFECPASVCQNVRCPAYPNAKCRIDNCGGCRPQWTHNIYIIENCQSRACPANTLEMVCNDDPCKYSTCVKHQHLNPVCRPSRCGGCKAQWFVNDREVNCFEQYGEDVPCPNGESRRKCPLNTCKFKKCPKDRTITCTIDNCGGCYPQYRNLRNEEVKCEGWWTPYESKRVRKLQGKASVTRGDTNTGRSGGTDTVHRNNLRDIPLQRNNIDRVAPVAPVAAVVPVKPVVPQGGGTPMLDNDSIRQSAQRGLESVLGVAARKEITRNGKFENAIDTGISKNDGLLNSKDIGPVPPVLTSTDPSGLVVDMPPPPPIDTSPVVSSDWGNTQETAGLPIVDSSGSVGLDSFGGPTGPQSSVDSPILDGPGPDPFSGSPTDIPPFDQFVPDPVGPDANFVSFAQNAVSNSVGTGQARDVPIVDSAPSFGSDSFSDTQSGPGEFGAMDSSANSRRDRTDPRKGKVLRASELRGDILSKRAPPKVIKDMRVPRPKKSKPLKQNIDISVGSMIIPDPISNADPSRIDTSIDQQGGGKASNKQTDSQNQQSVVILIHDNMGQKDMQPSLLDWLLRGLMGGNDFTGVPIQAMDQQQV